MEPEINATAQVDEKPSSKNDPFKGIPRHKCPETGLMVVSRTGLVPVFVDVEIPERGMIPGEIHGVLPKTAEVMIKNGFGRAYTGKEVLKAKAAA